MKHKFSNFFITLLAVVAIQFSAKATISVSDFTLDESQISAQFQTVSALENFIVDNFESADLSFVKTVNASLLSAVETSLNLNPSLPVGGDHPILGIPSFVWGLCLGVIGILAVYIIGDDLGKEERQAQTKKAAIGCLVGWGAGLIIYFVTVGSLFASASAI